MNRDQRIEPGEYARRFREQPCTLVELVQRRETHMGRTVTIGDITGTLAGVIPVAGRVQLVLIVGAARIFTDALPADTHVEVHQRSAS